MAHIVSSFTSCFLGFHYSALLYIAENLHLKKSALFLPFIALIFLLASCSKPQGFEYRDVKNIKIEQLGFNQSALTMDLVYYNPNGFGVDLRKVDCNIYVDKNYLGKFQLDTLMHIPRRAEFSLPSRVVVDMKSVFMNTLNLVFSNEILVDVKGTTKVGKAGIFMTVPFNYSGKHKVALF